MTWTEFLCAMNTSRWEDAKQHGDDLLQWFRKGGFVPEGVAAATGIENPFALARDLKSALMLLYWITGTPDQIS